MSETLIVTFRTLNDILTAGIAITAFSLLLYALSFNLRDRVARSFAVILLCVVGVYVAEALSSVSPSTEWLDFWLRLQWVGIIFLPPSYMHLSDALLATTGRPSRGRRRWLVRLLYLVSFIFLLLLPTGKLVGPLVAEAQPAPHLQRTPLTWVFSFYYLVIMLLAMGNFLRSFKRTLASTSRRRMAYLLIGGTAPALGSFPYLLFGSGFAARFPIVFWSVLTFSNLSVSALLVLMAYAVAFFGVPWPDRVVKRRLAKWLMRGPVTASTALAITTLTNRLGHRFNLNVSAALPVIWVGVFLLLEHLITLLAPVWERFLLRGKDRAEIELLQTLDERLLTAGDLQQFLEAILAAICDRLQASQAFIAALGPPQGERQALEMLVMIGGDVNTEVASQRSVEIVEAMGQSAELSPVSRRKVFAWGGDGQPLYWLLPLFRPSVFEDGDQGSQARAEDGLIGLLGIRQEPGGPPGIEMDETLEILTNRAAQALDDRWRQQQAFSSLQALTPQIERIQRLRAAAQYDQAELLAPDAVGLAQSDLASWVKEALTHYWGGPKLTQSPLLDLQVVQQTAQETQESRINALRAVLRKAIEDIRPEGDRHFTAEWILYNILEMKFLEGRKVREIALRLAMSEADYYRKQRVAIEAVANAIAEMEKEARRELEPDGKTTVANSTAVSSAGGVTSPKTIGRKTSRRGRFNGNETQIHKLS